MLRAILFLLALIALPVALLALVRSGRRPGNERATTPVAAALVALPTEPAADAGEGATAPPPAQATEVGAGFHELAFGAPLKPPSDEPVHRQIGASVDILLTGPVLKPEYAPRRPLLLPKLVQAVNDESVSRRELAVLIAQDPALAGNLLRLANSAMYRVSSDPVESIDRAVALLGTSGIRSLMAAALLQPVFRTAAGELKRFPEVTWEHTQYAASAAEAYAAIIADEDPFAAQLLALLFGLATILTFRACMDEYAARAAAPDAATVASLIEQHAATVASRIAHDWELSSRMMTALEEQSPYTRAASPSGLGQALGFGRYCGKVAVLRHAGRFDEDAALAAIRAGGYGGASAERIWARLAKQATAS